MPQVKWTIPTYFPLFPPQCRARNKLELNRRLVGATLGEAEDTLDDAKAWIKRSKKKEKELAAKRQAELDSRDALDSEAYTESQWSHLIMTAPILTAPNQRILKASRSAMTSKTWKKERHGY